MGDRPAGWRPFAVSLLAIGLGLPLPAFSTIGGPDDGGYTWVDGSDGGPSYDYEFGPSSGQLFGVEDDGSTPVTIPFPFTFYGVEYTSVRVHANGGVTFGSSASLGANHSCPVTAGDAPSAFPFWIDLDPSAGGELYAGSVGEAPNRRFLVEWYQVPLYSVVAGSAGSGTFELKLFEADHHIEFHYLDVDFSGSDSDDGASAYIGLARPGDSLPFSCDEATITADEALGFYPPSCNDVDGDGSCELDDCDNGDPTVYPGAPEVCDGLDNDCSGQPGADEVDNDNDGYRECDDCDDNDPDKYPADLDGDGWSPCLGDCDDTDALVSGVDVDGDGLSGCDGDCNDSNPNLSLADLDADGHTSCEDDCDDDDGTVFEGAPELCDGRDNDCDGQIDENPNCNGDDDDDSVAEDAVAWGCFVRCDASGAPAPMGLGWLACLGLFVLFSRRRRVASGEPR